MRTIAYYRVSTARQGVSGLGLDAQREAVRLFLAGKGWPPLGEFIEVESGRRNDRPQLAAALAACRLHGATLIVAKLDRLARNVAFVSALMESGVDFVAVDFPMANRLTVHILAAVAEHEAGMISARTKAALAAAKARGVVLGGHPERLTGHRAVGTARSAQNRRARAAKRADDLAPTISAIRAAGATSFRAIAAQLNARSVPAPRGGVWHPATVRQVLRAGGSTP